MMRAHRFNRLVLRALEEVPEPFKERLANVDIVVKRRPGPSDHRAGGAKMGDRLYGLYEGIPLSERTGGHGFELPDKITLFREPLERDFRDDSDLVSEVRKTVLHEIAHFFGLSEEKLVELGLD
ncbi:MAG TPA: metallopeptidase family protein [Dehalococcoidia bacterium]|nr:metallopeptidase family protein [Dehalococcoidia bacterium]